MKVNFAPGLHVALGQAANVSAYYSWIGRWSRLLVPAVVSAAEITPGYRILDVSTGTGEAALMALPAVGGSGVVIGADIAPAMLVGARDRLKDPLFCPVAADGQALPFKSDTFDAVICQLGLQFFSTPRADWQSSIACSGPAAAQHCAWFPPPTGRRCGGFSLMC